MLIWWHVLGFIGRSSLLEESSEGFHSISRSSCVEACILLKTYICAKVDVRVGGYSEFDQRVARAAPSSRFLLSLSLSAAEYEGTANRVHGTHHPTLSLLPTTKLELSLRREGRQRRAEGHHRPSRSNAGEAQESTLNASLEDPRDSRCTSAPAPRLRRGQCSPFRHPRATRLLLHRTGQARSDRRWRERRDTEGASSIAWRPNGGRVPVQGQYPVSTLILDQTYGTQDSHSP